LFDLRAALGASAPPTTRANPTPSQYSITDTAAFHHASPALTKKYIYLLKAGKPLPSNSKGGTPAALTGPEEKALVTFLRSVEKTAFAVTEVTRAGAEMEIQHIEGWYQELDGLIRTLDIKPYNFWNFNETPLQIGWIRSSLKLFST
jgi:hypothetical protein